MSDRGLPTAPMFMNGYGSHTFSFWNRDGERFSFHFKTQQGHQHYTNDEAAAVIGGSRRETYQRGERPKWTLKVQVMPELDAEKTAYNPLT